MNDPFSRLYQRSLINVPLSAFVDQRSFISVR